MKTTNEEKDCYLPATMDELESYLNENGWTVDKDEEGWDIRQASPAGEDFGFYIRHDNTVETAVKEIQQYAYDFDSEEHVKLNLGANGAPGVIELVEDARAIQKMLNVLADGVNWCKRETIRESVEKHNAVHANADDARTEVYVVIAERDMSNFTDHYGETAPDSTEIIGIYAKKEKALAEVDRLAAQNAKDVAELDCDECRYWAAPYTVQ